MCALVSAYKLFPQSEGLHARIPRDGVRSKDPYNEAKNWGLVHWVRPILNVPFDGNADTTSYEVDQLFGSSHFCSIFLSGIARSKTPNAVSEDFDDASPDNIARIERKAVS
jgi:hypothetical protein